MISQAELIKQLSATMGKKTVLELSRILKEQQFALHDLIDLTFFSDKDIAFRAAWILENIFLADPLSYKADLSYLIGRMAEVKHESCKRHYAKIMMHITDKKAPATIKDQLNQIDLEHVVEQCFDWMINPKIKIAVKCFSAEVIFNLRHQYPWVKEELSSQLEFLMRNGSPGIQSKGRRLLSSLK